MALPCRIAAANPDFVNHRISDVNSMTQPSTLRALQAHLTSPKVASVMAGVAVILGLSGPFDTWATLVLPLRMLYWALIVLLTYAAGFVVTYIVAPRVRLLHAALRTLIIGFLVAIAVYAVLTGLNLLFGLMAKTTWEHFLSLGSVLLICLVIEATSQVFGNAEASITAPPAKALDAPALLQRLPLERRGALVSVSVQDHYVDVTTTKGRAMLLMRLGDAMRETDPEPGLQVHRSHWVARAQVAAVRRNGEGAALIMRHGPDIPVSRAYMPAVRGAGLLPRKGA